jgi:hypothetical protein
MKLKHLTFYQFLIILAFLLAIFLRLFLLGSAPLSDTEAYWANQALQVSNSSTDLDLGPQPGYVMLTSLLFSLFGATNFLARLLPALAGSVLIIAPVLFLGKLASNNTFRIVLLFLVFGLAIDPSLVTFSRQAGSTIPALSFTIIAVSSWINRKWILAGISLGLALLFGPGVINGALSLAFAVIIMVLFLRSYGPTTNQEADEIEDESQTKEKKFTSLGLTLGIAAGTILLVSTLFFQKPIGFTAWLETFPAYFQGWTTSSGVPAVNLIIALLLYELFPFIFYLVGLFQGLSKKFINNPLQLSMFALMIPWSVFALILSLLYPSRQVADMVWFILPFWVIAAWALAIVIPSPKINPQSVLLALTIFILLTLFWLTLSSLTYYIPNDPLGEFRGLVPLGILILIAMLVALVGLGWNSFFAMKGLAWSVFVFLLLYSISVMWGASFLRTNQPTETLFSIPGTGQTNLVVSTLDDLSSRNKGGKGYLDILTTVDSPSLKWALRNYPLTRYVEQLAVNEEPEIVITQGDQNSPSLSASYTGQDFTWWERPGWIGPTPVDIIRWWNYRTAPIINDKIIVWVRTDLFPGGELQPSPVNSENP